MMQDTSLNILPLPPQVLLQGPHGPASTKYVAPPPPVTFIELLLLDGGTPGETTELPPRGVTEPGGGARPLRPKGAGVQPEGEISVLTSYMEI
jgi:hypothetical protein